MAYDGSYYHVSGTGSDDSHGPENIVARTQVIKVKLRNPEAPQRGLFLLPVTFKWDRIRLSRWLNAAKLPCGA